MSFLLFANHSFHFSRIAQGGHSQLLRLYRFSRELLTHCRSQCHHVRITDGSILRKLLRSQQGKYEIFKQVIKIQLSTKLLQL
jgi:hypothetical protein